MLQVLSGVKAEAVSNVLPKELSLVIHDLSSDMPTHILAVYSHQVPAATKCRVTLVPTHNIILASPHFPLHKCIDHLFATLLLQTASAALYAKDTMGENVHTQLQQFATKPMAIAPICILLRAMAVNKLWRNACPLGVADEQLWCAMNIAWEILIHTFAILTNLHPYPPMTHTHRPKVHH